MNTSILSSDDSSKGLDMRVASRGRYSFTILAVVLALAVTAGLLFGFMYLRKRYAAQHPSAAAPAQPQQKSVKSALPVQAQIFEDEAMLKGSQALIGGTVQNVSQETLQGLTVEIELTRRQDGGSERRSLSIQPADLAPGGQGKYSMLVPRTYSLARVVRVQTGERATEIGFKTAPGEKRPLEGPPPTKTVIVQKPSSTKDGDFINTADNPSRVP